MNPVLAATRQWYADALAAWNQFWFTPARPETLALLRILGGAMLFYTHLVWSFDLAAFLGPQSWVDNATALELQRGWGTWSHLWYVDSLPLLWALHLASLAIMALFTLGLFTRVTAVLTFLITLSYCHRLHGALYGLDQVNALLAMYLMLAPCGAAYSLDRWRSRGAGSPSSPPRSTMTNIATRLIQLHLCVIYLFGGISKLRGSSWWDGSAVWFAISSLEYQSLDLTWLVKFTWIIALLTHITVFWETFYCFTVWPKWSRPVTLALAVAVHGGIALALGMPTFGLAMIIANMAFVSPELVAATVESIARLVTRRGVKTQVPAGIQAPKRKERRLKLALKTS